MGAQNIWISGDMRWLLETGSDLRDEDHYLVDSWPCPAEAQV